MDKMTEIRTITMNNRTVLKAVDARTACLEQFAQVNARFPLFLFFFFRFFLLKNHDIAKKPHDYRFRKLLLPTQLKRPSRMTRA